MTKRFTYEYDEYNGNLFDNEHNTFYPIEDSEENIHLLCIRLNKIVDENEQLKKRLKNIEANFKFSYTDNHVEFEKDKLDVEDNHTTIHLKEGNLFIEVYIPQINEYYRFKYRVTGKSLMREFIENYNSNGDVE